MSNAGLDVSQEKVDDILQGIVQIVEQARTHVAIYVNQELTMMYWHIGKYILQEINYQDKAEYGKKIVATLSQLLSSRYGSGYTKTALFRMLKVVRLYPDEQTVATLSQQLTWSHLIEQLAFIKQ